MSRRVSGVVACAAVVGLSLSGCSGGGAKPEAGPSPSPVAGSASPPRSAGEPAYADADAAYAAIQDYNARNNALIQVANRPPFPRDAFAPVDTGPTLAQDRWEIALAAADAKHRSSKGWFFDRPSAVYLPASAEWPKLVLSAGDSHVEGQEPAKPGRWTSLSVFVQKKDGAALQHHASIQVLRHKLPEPLPPDADQAVAGRDAAVSLARALAKHWTRSTPSVPGFASTRLLDADLARDRALPPGPNAITWTARLLGDADGVHAVAVEGGTLVVADFTVLKTIRALGVGSLVYWSGDYAKVLGAAKRRSVSATTYAGAVWFMPSGGGDAVPLGATRVEAVF